MKRRALVAALGVIASVGVMLFAYIGKRSLDPSERSEAGAQPTFNLSGMRDGELRQFRTRRGIIFAYRPSEQTWAGLKSMTPVPAAQVEARFNADAGVFLYFGYDTRFGCELIHKPGADGLSLTAAAAWGGGYMDRCNHYLYDYAGRNVLGVREYPQLRGVRVVRVEDQQVTVDLRSGS